MNSSARLIAEVEPESEIEARLVKRMAIAFWKSERAERIEVALFDAAPKLRPPQAGFEWEVADPLTTFDLKRFNAVRGYQAQQGRELPGASRSCGCCAANRSRIARTNPRARHGTNPTACPRPTTMRLFRSAMAHAEQDQLLRNEPDPRSDPAPRHADPQPLVDGRLLDIWGHPPSRTAIRPASP